MPAKRLRVGKAGAKFSILTTLSGTMDKTVSAADANRKFSEILRSVRKGQSYIVTSHGKAVARIVPTEGQDAAHERSRETLLRRLRTQKVIDVGPWSRDELYDE